MTVCASCIIIYHTTLAICYDRQSDIASDAKYHYNAILSYIDIDFIIKNVLKRHKNKTNEFFYICPNCSLINANIKSKVKYTPSNRLYNAFLVQQLSMTYWLKNIMSIFVRYPSNIERAHFENVKT